MRSVPLHPDAGPRRNLPVSRAGPHTRSSDSSESPTVQQLRLATKAAAESYRNTAT